jgi:hypothetical protein
MASGVLAPRFRGLLRKGTPDRLDASLNHAWASGVYVMQRFARTIRRDLEAVRNAVFVPWSKRADRRTDQQIEGLKRAMYGRAGVGLLRARMMPLQEDSLHQEQIRPLGRLLWNRIASSPGTATHRSSHAGNGNFAGLANSNAECSLNLLPHRSRPTGPHSG